jgi:hypothetical protein
MSQKREEPEAPKLTLTFSKQRKKSSKRSKRARRETEAADAEQAEGLALDADAAALAGDGAEVELLVDGPMPYGPVSPHSAPHLTHHRALRRRMAHRRSGGRAAQVRTRCYGRLHAYAAAAVREVSQVRVLTSKAEAGAHLLSADRRLLQPRTGLSLPRARARYRAVGPRRVRPGLLQRQGRHRGAGCREDARRRAR